MMGNNHAVDKTLVGLSVAAVAMAVWRFLNGDLALGGVLLLGAAASVALATKGQRFLQALSPPPDSWRARAPLSARVLLLSGIIGGAAGIAVYLVTRHLVGALVGSLAIAAATALVVFVDLWLQRKKT